MISQKWKTIFCALLITACLPLSSCLKKENLDSESDSSIPAEVFQKTLIDAYVEDDSYAMKYGEEVTYTITQAVQDPENRRSVREESYEIIEKTRLSQQYALRFNIVLGDKDIINNTQKTTESISVEVPDVINELSQQSFKALNQMVTASNGQLVDENTSATKKNDLNTFDASKLLRLFSPRMFYSLFLICGSDKEKNCFNLKTETELLMAPSNVILGNKCKVGSDCRLRTKKISFDFISTDEQNKRQKVNISVRISHDTPYLGRVLEFCQQTLVPYGETGQKVLVRLCQTITDYKFGTDQITEQ